MLRHAFEIHEFGSLPMLRCVVFAVSVGVTFCRRQVFLSGCLHGDEQVGPTAVMEAAKLMVYAAVCDADSSAEVRLLLSVQKAEERKSETSNSYLHMFSSYRAVFFLTTVEPVRNQAGVEGRVPPFLIQNQR